MDEEYKSEHTGPVIDAGITRVLPGGEIDQALSEKLGFVRQIIAGEDLDSFTTYGGYSWTQADAASILNVPAINACHMYVFRGDNQSGIARTLQIAVTSTADSSRKMWWRNHTDSGWSDWRQIATATSPTEYDLSFSSDAVATYNTSKYWKDQFGVVTFYLSVKTASDIASGTTIATLPSGFRPAYYKELDVIAKDGTPVTVNVMTSGAIRLGTVVTGKIIQTMIHFVAGG